MSGRLVSAVFDSALPAWLKRYAAVCASFAADDGTRVYPSIECIARMAGRRERATRTAIQELRRRGVLTVEGPPRRNRATRYVFQAAALPRIGDPDQLGLFPQALVLKAGAKVPKGTVINRRPQQLTGSGLHPKGAVDCPRSVSDPSVRTHQRARTKTGTA